MLQLIDAGSDMHRADKVRKIFFLLRCLSPVAWQHGRTPLWYAAFNGRDLIVAALYARGASLDKVAILQRSETLAPILRLQVSFQEILQLAASVKYHRTLRLMLQYQASEVGCEFWSSMEDYFKGPDRAISLVLSSGAALPVVRGKRLQEVLSRCQPCGSRWCCGIVEEVVREQHRFLFCAAPVAAYMALLVGYSFNWPEEIVRLVFSFLPNHQWQRALIARARFGWAHSRTVHAVSETLRTMRARLGVEIRNARG